MSDPRRLIQTARLVAVLDRLRTDCPWDARQTHLSLVPYLVEETCEVVEAIETGSPADLREELGDLLLQVVFHARLATERPAGFDLEGVAAGIADKLIARHPHVFAPVGGSGRPDAVPADLYASWEQRKAVEKGRTSVLDGIPARLSALSRAAKILTRARSRRVPLAPGTSRGAGEADRTGADSAAASAEEIGEAILALVVRADAAGIDAEQATRAAVRRLEDRVRDAESGESQA